MPLLPRRYTRVHPLLAALFASGCTQPGNFEPVNARRMAPPAIYRTWWSQVEACTEVAAEFDRVDWYEADEILNTDEETRHIGAWLPPHAIYIQKRYVLSESGVKHEIVHELLRTRGHELPLFAECAGL